MMNNLLDGIIDYDRRFIDPSSDIALTTAGCFATYPKPYMSTIGGIIDQVDNQINVDRDHLSLLDHWHGNNVIVYLCNCR